MMDCIYRSDEFLLTSEIDAGNRNAVNCESYPSCSAHPRIERTIPHEPCYESGVEYSTQVFEGFPCQHVCRIDTEHFAVVIREPALLRQINPEQLLFGKFCVVSASILHFKPSVVSLLSRPSSVWETSPYLIKALFTIRKQVSFYCRIVIDIEAESRKGGYQPLSFPSGLVALDVSSTQHGLDDFLGSPILADYCFLSLIIDDESIY